VPRNYPLRDHQPRRPSFRVRIGTSVILVSWCLGGFNH
jgi:hypothetical protein